MARPFMWDGDVMTMRNVAVHYAQRAISLGEGAENECTAEELREIKKARGFASFLYEKVDRMEAALEAQFSPCKSPELAECILSHR